MTVADPDSLLGAGRQLLRDVAAWAGRTGLLAAEEARQTARRAGRIALCLAGALLLAAVGMVFVLTGAAVALGNAVGAMWIGFVAVGALLGLTGGVGAALLVRRLADPSLRFPVTRAEIRSDLRWNGSDDGRNGNGSTRSSGDGERPVRTSHDRPRCSDGA